MVGVEPELSSVSPYPKSRAQSQQLRVIVRSLVLSSGMSAVRNGAASPSSPSTPSSCGTPAMVTWLGAGRPITPPNLTVPVMPCPFPASVLPASSPAGTDYDGVDVNGRSFRIGECVWVCERHAMLDLTMPSIAECLRFWQTPLGRARVSLRLYALPEDAPRGRASSDGEVRPSSTSPLV